jgi:hypothetical protein
MKQGTISPDARGIVQRHEQRLAGTRLRLHLRRQLARAELRALEDLASPPDEPADGDAEHPDG